MSDARPTRDRSDRPGATTSGKGTPAAVDVSASRRARLTVTLFFAGPVIWSVHFMVVYLVVEAGCTGDGPGLRIFDPPVPTTVTLWATVVAAVACLGCAAVSYRLWRGEQGDRDGGPPAPTRADTGRSLLFGGFVLSLLGVVTVLVVGVPALVLPACLP